MKIYGPRTIQGAPWPDTEQGRFARDYLVPLVRDGTRRYVSDTADMRVVSIDDLMIPIAVSEAAANSPVCSTLARFFDIPIAALPNLGWHPTATAAARTTLSGLAALLRAADIDRCVYVGNWLVLRGLEPHLTVDQVRRLTGLLRGEFPDHALVFPAVCTATHHRLLTNLAACDYKFLFAGHTRLLSPYQPAMTRQWRENRRRDARLLASSGYEVVDGADVPRCEDRLCELYKLLNRDKYSINPLVREAFIAYTLQSGVMSYRLLRKHGRVDAFYGYAIANGVLCPPLFGYDTRAPASVGLYRMMYSLLVDEALALGWTLETGSGADAFKSHRGDAPIPRFGAYSVDHLSRRRRLAWRALSLYVTRLVAPSTGAYLERIDGPEAAGLTRVPRQFAPRGKTPIEASRALRQALASIQADLDDGFALTGQALLDRVAAVTDRLSNWPHSPRLIAPLRDRLAALTRRASDVRRADARRDSARVLEHTRALLDRVEHIADTAVIMGAIEAATPAHLRAAAHDAQSRHDRVVVVLASVDHGKVRLLTAVSPQVLARGVRADALLLAIAPIVGGGGGGGPDIAWGGGSEARRLDEAFDAARAYLQHVSAA